MNYSQKSSDYFGNVRTEIIKFIKDKKEGLKILEIGAAYGETLHYLKEKGIASEVVAVDIYKDVKNLDKYKPVDKFIFGNIDDLDMSEYEKHFDTILMLDVLEHIAEPDNVLRALHDYLSDNGEVIISVPNIRHISAFIKIFVKGSFKYESSGIFDYTHMRFYCRRDVEELLNKYRFTVLQFEGSIRNYKGWSISKIINLLTFGLFEEFLSYQIFFKVVKRP